MNSKRKFLLAIFAAFSFVASSFSGGLLAQTETDTEVCGYALVERTVYDQTPVTVTMQVNETVMQRQSVTTQRPVYRTETRERTRSVLKPVIRTSEREERETVLQPYIETVMEDRVVDKTVYETVTEMEDRMFVVEEPATETVMEEREVLVRRPVTRQVMQTRDVTAYKPVTVQELQQVSGSLELQQLSEIPGTGRWCRQWLGGGNYVDPVSGLSVFRKRGFHWVRQGQQYALTTSSIPVVSSQPVSRTTLVPETVQVREPVEMTTMEEVYETRRVPVEIETTRQRVETRKVPVERQVERTVQVVEQVPVERTRHVEETITRRVPERELVYETVEYTEEYEQPVTEWVDVTENVEVPVVVPRDVEVELIKHTPRTVMMRIPLDRFGNPIGPAEPVQNAAVSTARYGDVVSAANAAARRQIVNRPPTIASGEWQSTETTPAAEEPQPLGNRPVTNMAVPNERRVAGFTPADDSESGAVSILDAGDDESSDSNEAGEQAGDPAGTEEQAEEFVEFRSRPQPADPTAIQVPQTNVAPAFDSVPRTELTNVWRPPIPGRPDVEGEDADGEDSGNPEAASDQASNEDVEGEDEQTSGSPEPADSTVARRPVFPPGTGPEEPEVEDAEPAVVREAPLQRTDGGTSLRDRFPDAEVLDDTTDAADRAPSIERRRN
ncbi:MAG: hypothetical protein AAF456_04065 [Planctomycetota bacterium]